MYLPIGINPRYLENVAYEEGIPIDRASTQSYFHLPCSLALEITFGNPIIRPITKGYNAAHMRKGLGL